MWEQFEFNPPYEGEKITKINGVKLPKNYLAFMKQHNGGEGETAGGSWLVLFPLEELQQMNDDYEIPEYLPDHIIIGDNGGGEFFGINKKGEYFIVPEIIDEENLSVLGKDINVLPEEIDKFWKDI